MGHTFFPLTPALSPGERENPPPSSGHARDGVGQSSVAQNTRLAAEGGQGEGNDGSIATGCPKSKGPQKSTVVAAEVTRR